MESGEWFDVIELAEIQSFIENREQEDLHLEFKTINKPDLTHPDDRKNFARALSGFANTSGGIVVWGVSANDFEGIDCAIKTLPINRVSLFCSRLQSLTSAWIDPPIKGVRHKLVRPEESIDEGFVVSYIPESESGPHMVTLNKEYRYYMRVGDSFIPMPHSHVADRFFRKRRPRLSLYSALRNPRIGTVQGYTRLIFDLLVGIKNEGKATAKYPYLSIRVNDPFVVSRTGLHKGQDGLRKLRWNDQSEPHRWAGNADHVIHPESYLEVALIKGEIPDLGNRQCNHLVIDYEIMAEDTELSSGKEVLALDEIISDARED